MSHGAEQEPRDAHPSGRPSGRHAEPAEPSPETADQGGGAVMIAAFEGWNDAGSAASATVDHLRQVWDAAPRHELDPEEFHDFQVNRPMVALDEDGVRRISWPTTSAWTASPQGRRMLLVHGIEPSMRWRTFCSQLLDLAAAEGVATVVTLGALLADVPHTRPIPVTASSDDAQERERFGLEQSTYQGPTGIVGVLQHEAAARGLSSMSVWAAVPHYVAHPPSPKATLALVHRLESLLGVSVPLGELAEDAQAWQHGVDELAGEDAEVAQYVRQLEEAKDTADLPEASGEAIAQEFERYLRRRDTGQAG